MIDNFQKHLGQASSNDVALFYYSGHGSQEASPPEFWHLEPDRKDETLVCWDSRTSEGWDLADKELAYLIAQVAKNNPHIIIILDCCHSGSGTRDVEQTLKVRHAPADRRPRKIGDFIFGQEVEQAQASGLSWNLPSGKHMLLAACQDREVASEYAGDGEQRGAFSYFLLETLTKASSPLSYRELFKRISALIRSRIKDQTPQLEATNLEDLDNLPFLGTPDAIQTRDPFFTLWHDGKDWVIDGGAVHGIPQVVSEDTVRLALFPQGSTKEQLQQFSEAVGEAEIVRVLSDHSVVRLTRTSEEFNTDTVLNAVIINLPLPALGVYFEGDTEALEMVRQKLQIAGPSNNPSLYVREVDDLVNANYRLLVRNGQYLITNPLNDRPLVEQLEGYTEFNARKAVQILEHLARWTTTVELANPESQLPANAIKLQVYCGNEEIKDPTIQLTCEYSNGQWQQPTFRLKLTNTYHQRLYCAILDVAEDYSVSVPPLFPVGSLAYGGVWIEAGEEKWAAMWSGNYKIQDDIPAKVPEELLDQGITQYQDILKLIFCTTEFDATLLEQDSLPPPKAELKKKEGTKDVPINSTLNLLMYRIQTRQFGVIAAPAIDAWNTSQLSIVTVHLRDMAAIQTNRETSLGAGVAIQPHSGLQGVRARLSTVPQATRDVGSNILPPILRDYTQPFQFTASRGVDPGLSVLELKLTDANTLNAVTREQPLKLLVDRALDKNEYVLPVAYNEDFFISLGRGEAKDGKTEICIERLTEPLKEKKRSLGGSIRIFFQKIVAEKLGLEFPYPILAAVEQVEEETICYEGDLEEVKRRVASANKIVLFIHGIIGDTQSIVPCASLAKISLVVSQSYFCELIKFRKIFSAKYLEFEHPQI